MEMTLRERERERESVSEKERERRESERERERKREGLSRNYPRCIDLQEGFPGIVYQMEKPHKMFVVSQSC